MTAMPVLERMTAEDLPARPCYARKRGAEPIDVLIADHHVDGPDILWCHARRAPSRNDFARALDALFGR